MLVSCRLPTYLEIPIIKILRDKLLLVVSAARRKCQHSYHILTRNGCNGWENVRIEFLLS